MINVRWRLKSGAEYIIQDVDLNEVMNEYFRRQTIYMPWESEKRSYSPREDLLAILGIDITGDAAQIKWTVESRLPSDSKPSATGRMPPQKTISTDYIVKLIRGKPVNNLDFTNNKQFLQR